jgi:uncharacterized protein (UPF0264 family)
VAGLLVSVRSADEAVAALQGGASIIDVKEPGRGALGRADAAVWRSVQAVVPQTVPVSVALGELTEWTAGADPHLCATDFGGLAYRKLGLAGGGPGWRRSWDALRIALGPGPAWVAVAYADWRQAGAPDPEAVLEAALGAAECTAILVDTWDKSAAGSLDLDLGWAGWFDRARGGGLRTALAGSLDEAAIVRLAPLRPDWFAVRGAACQGGDRGRPIDPARVTRLARRAAGD